MIKFKQSESADLIAEAMRRVELESKAETATHANKISRAYECLNEAAELYENLGNHEMAKYITDAMHYFQGGK